jgi:hypothetical protein
MKGNENSVIFGYDSMISGAGSIFTHNHPIDYSFSPPDVNSAMRLRTLEMRIVSSKHRYSLKPPRSGWNQDFHDRVWLPEYEKELTRLRPIYQERARNRNQTTEQMNHEFTHELIKNVSQKTGVQYGRTKYRPVRLPITTQAA